MYSIMRATSFSVFNCKVFLPSLNKVIYLFIYYYLFGDLQNTLAVMIKIVARSETRNLSTILQYALPCN